MKRRLAIIVYAVLFMGVTFLLLSRAADEIQMTCQIQVSKGEFDLERQPGSIDIDMTGIGASDLIQIINTNTHELLTVTLPSGTNGVYWFRNTTTNTDRYVEIGPQGAATNLLSVWRLEANEVSTGRIHPTNTLHAQAFNGPVNLRVLVVED